MTAESVILPAEPGSPRSGLGAILRRQVLVPLGTAAVVIAFLATHDSRGAPAAQALPPVPHNAAVELRFGIRISQIAVTAGGGMVDVRYIALDPDRALAFGHRRSTFPVLVDERTGRELGGLAMSMFPHHLLAGRQYYLLYRNDGGTVRSGDTVSVRMGSLWLRHVVVR